MRVVARRDAGPSEPSPAGVSQRVRASEVGSILRNGGKNFRGRSGAGGFGIGCAFCWACNESIEGSYGNDVIVARGNGVCFKWQ